VVRIGLTEIFVANLILQATVSKFVSLFVCLCVDRDGV